ncbi:MAG: OmpA family protein [Bacteroidota bacterium]
MTGTTKVIIMLVVWLLYALVAYFGCLQDCCGDLADDGRGLTEEVAPTTTTEAAALAADTVTAAAPAVNNYALASKWSELNLYTTDEFADLKGSVLADMTDDNILEITGLYYEGEEKPEGFENMGLARANAIWNTHFGDVPEERIKLRARLANAVDLDSLKASYFNAANFRWLDAEAKVATLEEIEGLATIIRYPFASSEEEYTAEVKAYLDKITERVKETKERVMLTGHTDNVGDPEANMRLGQRRAESIKQILVDKGVDAAQISTDSKGETQPIASNSTAEGRHDNRRCEVLVIANKTN